MLDGIGSLSAWAVIQKNGDTLRTRFEARKDMTADAEETVMEALRDLARWLYRQLEREYDYLTSDEAVDEAIVANEYSFTVDGKRFG